jgi:hypothetical protein
VVIVTNPINKLPFQGNPLINSGETACTVDLVKVQGPLLGKRLETPDGVPLGSVSTRNI